MLEGIIQVKAGINLGSWEGKQAAVHVDQPSLLSVYSGKQELDIFLVSISTRVSYKLPYVDCGT